MPPQAGRLVLAVACAFRPLLCFIASRSDCLSSISPPHPCLPIDFLQQAGPRPVCSLQFRAAARPSSPPRDHLTSGADTRTLRQAAFFPPANLIFPFLFHLMGGNPLQTCTCKPPWLPRSSLLLPFLSHSSLSQLALAPLEPWGLIEARTKVSVNSTPFAYADLHFWTVWYVSSPCIYPSPPPWPLVLPVASLYCGKRYSETQGAFACEYVTGGSPYCDSKRAALQDFIR